MKRVKYDKTIPTVPAGHEYQDQIHKTQEQLDDILRLAAGPHAIEAMTQENKSFQIYRLSNGKHLRIWKRTGKIE